MSAAATLGDAPGAGTVTEGDVIDPEVIDPEVIDAPVNDSALHEGVDDGSGAGLGEGESGGSEADPTAVKTIIAPPTDGIERIAISIPAFARGKGGAERTAAEVAGLLAKAGHAVAIVCNEQRQKVPSYPVPEGVAFIPCDYFSMMAHKRHAAERKVAEFGPTMAILFYADASLYKQIRFFTHFPGIALMAQECTNPIRAVRNIKRTYANRIDLREAFWVRQAGLAQLDAIRFTIPGYGKSVAPDLQPFVRGFYNSFTFATFDQPPHESRRRIVSVGGLKDVNKNGMAVLHAFAEIADDFPGWTLDFYGVNNFPDYFESVVEKHGLGDRVTFRGIAERAEDLYGGAAISVVSSFEEGNPNVVNEAMAYSVPSIGFVDCQGVNHLIEDGVTGILVERANEIQSLAAGMAKLMASTPLRQSIAERASTLVRERCDPVRYRQNWLAMVALARQNRTNRDALARHHKPFAPYFHSAMDPFRPPFERIWPPERPRHKRTWIHKLFGRNHALPRRPLPIETIKYPWEQVKSGYSATSKSISGQVKSSVEHTRSRSNWFKHVFLPPQLRALAVFREWAFSFVTLLWYYRRYDKVIIHDTLAVWPAWWLSGGRRDRVVVDVGETPRLLHRTSDIHRKSIIPFHNLYQRHARRTARRGGTILVQSRELKRVVRQVWSRGSFVWVHVRPKAQLSEITAVPRTPPAPDGPIKVAWPSDLHALTGEGMVIDLLEDGLANPRPNPIQIVFIGARIPPERMAAMSARYGEAVTFLDRLPEDDYLKAIRACHAVLIGFDINHENTRICIPNRLLDAVQIGVPVASTFHPSMRRVLDFHPDCGVIAPSRQPGVVADAIREASALSPKPLTEDEIATAFVGIHQSEVTAVVQGERENEPPMKRVALVTLRQVVDRPRFHQLAQALARDVEVTTFSRHNGRWQINKLPPPGA